MRPSPPTALSPREGDVPIMGWQPRKARGGSLPGRAGSRAGQEVGGGGCRCQYYGMFLGGGQYYGMPERRGARVREYYGMFLGVKVRGGTILWDVTGGRGGYYGMPGRAVSGKF